MLYCTKLAGKHLSRYLNQIESVGFRKAYCWRQIGDLTVSDAKCLYFFTLHTWRPEQLP